MKLCVLGHVGTGQQLLNGQTLKTRNLVDGLEKQAGLPVEIVDSSRWLRHPLRLVKQLRQAFQSCDGVIMLPAQRGVQVFAPLMVYFAKKYRKKIYYDVIGGWLPELLKGKKSLQKALMAFDGIWVETATMERKLRAMGFSNVQTIPNFKQLRPLEPRELERTFAEPYRLCTFSRVMEEKGIGVAVEAVKSANEALGRRAFTLDIYGQVEAGSREWFADLQKRFPDCVEYRGAVDSRDSVSVLKAYFALLFPTWYAGEGLAGTLIDAYFAGVPVVASDWRYNREFVTEATGLLVPVGDSRALAACLEQIAGQPEIITQKKTACLEYAGNFTPERVMRQILQALQGEGAAV